MEWVLLKESPPSEARIPQHVPWSRSIEVSINEVDRFKLLQSCACTCVCCTLRTSATDRCLYVHIEVVPVVWLSPSFGS